MTPEELLAQFDDEFHDWIDGDEWPKVVRVDEDGSLLVTFTDSDEDDERETGTLRVSVTKVI